MKQIKILNYNSGNITSIINSLQLAGYPASVICERQQIKESDLLILPGVGNAKSAMEFFKNSLYYNAVEERHKQGKPIIGICLGAQIMFEYLEEAECEGFGWMKGCVSRIKHIPYFNNGWSQLEYSKLREAGIGRSLKESNTFYFNHQYILPGRESKTISSTTGMKVPSIVMERNLVGIQFHPEKSQISGLKIIRNIIQDYYGI